MYNLGPTASHHTPYCVDRVSQEMGVESSGIHHHPIPQSLLAFNIDVGIGVTLGLPLGAPCVCPGGVTIEVEVAVVVNVVNVVVSECIDAPGRMVDT